MFDKIMRTLMGMQTPFVPVIQDFLFVRSGVMDDGSDMDEAELAEFAHQLMNAAGRSQVKNLALAIHEFRDHMGKPVVMYGDSERRRQFHTAATLSRLLSVECRDIALPIEGLDGEPLLFQDVLHDLRFRHLTALSGGSDIIPGSPQSRWCVCRCLRLSHCSSLAIDSMKGRPTISL